MAPRQRSDPRQRPLSPGRALLVAIPLGLAAALMLWIGDMYLTHREWLVGTVVFGLGLAATGLGVYQLRRAGMVR